MANSGAEANGEWPLASGNIMLWPDGRVTDQSGRPIEPCVVQISPDMVSGRAQATIVPHAAPAPQPRPIA
jgi:hypothetical protein